MTVWNDDGGEKRIIGHAEFPKNTGLPRNVDNVVDFIDAVEKRALFVHWKFSAIIDAVAASDQEALLG